MVRISAWVKAQSHAIASWVQPARGCGCGAEAANAPQQQRTNERRFIEAPGDGGEDRAATAGPLGAFDTKGKREMSKAQQAMSAVNFATQSGEAQHLIRAIKLLAEAHEELENKVRFLDAEVQNLRSQVRR